MNNFETKLLVSVFIVFILLILWYFHNSRVNDYETFMTGMWIADENFCKNADIASMRLFIGEKDDKRVAYLLIPDVCNQLMDIEYSSPLTNSLSSIKPYKLNANIIYKKGDKKIWPENITMEFNMIDQSLIIYQDDNLYASLFRDGELSNVNFD